MHCLTYLHLIVFFFKCTLFTVQEKFLREYAIKRNLHIIEIAETFVDNNVNEAKILIYGYKCYKKDKYVAEEGRRGRIILYVKEGDVSREFLDLNVIKAEAVWYKTKTMWNSEVVVGVCHKSQTADADESRALYVAISSASRKQVLIMGDINFPNMNWVINESVNSGTDFRDPVMDNYLVQSTCKASYERK
jgi:hypothetical protein